MDEIARFFAFDARLLEQVSTRQVAFDVGVAYLDEDCPERFYSSFLLVNAARSEVTAEALAGCANRILGSAGFRHRLIVVNDERSAAGFEPAFKKLRYTPSWNAVMSLQRPPDREGELRVDEVPFAETRGLIRQMYIEDPEIPDELADGFTEQQGKRERTIGARFFVGYVDGRRAGNCELYIEDHDAQIENVGTLVRYRGQGVARSVVLGAVAAARESGARHIFIVAAEDDWPKSLYERLGFQQIARNGEFLLAPFR